MGHNTGGNGQHMNILPEWEGIDPTELKGTLLVVGANSTAVELSVPRNLLNIFQVRGQ